MLNNAGAQRFVAELACNIDKSEFDVCVITTVKELPESAFHKQLIKNGISVINVGEKNYFKTYLKIRKLLKTKKPDIVHTNIGSSLHMLFPMLFADKNIKHYFTVHSMGYRIFVGLKKRIMRFFFKRGTIVPIAICDTVKKSVCEEYDLTEDQVLCVYNGVDTAKFLPKSDYFKGDKVNYVSVGTLYGLKNHSMLIDAFSILKKTRSDVSLTIVGGGVLYDELSNQINSLNLENDIVLTGDSPNVADFLTAADVYCCPSKVEGLPITVLEAMSVGLPVITTPAGGVVDIVKDGHNGFVVSHSNAEMMAEKMLELANNSDLLKKMSEISRREAERYDIKFCTKGYEEIYKRK